MSVVKIVDHPLIQHKISLLRDRNTGTNKYTSADTSPDRWGDYFGW